MFFFVKLCKNDNSFVCAYEFVINFIKITYFNKTLDWDETLTKEKKWQNKNLIEVNEIVQ